MRPALVLLLIAVCAFATVPARAQQGAGQQNAEDGYRVYRVVDTWNGQKVYRSHAIAMHGEPKYAADFRHFDYVNPDAPKGGEIRLGVQGTFDSFNAENGKGNAVGAGYETLLTSSADEAFTEYGLLAEWIEWPEDRSWVSFRLRDAARWHDGTPVTVEDVIWSYETLVSQGAPFYRFYFGAIESAEKVGEREVRFVFNEADNRELPLIVGQMPIMPKHYWEGRDFAATTLEPPLTSGPYRIAAFEGGRYVVRELVEDYWGADLPVNRGRNNFGRVRSEFFRDDTIIRTALKAGSLDYRQENQAKAWALAYDIPAVEQGWLRQEEIRHNQPTGMQAFVMNTRRPVFRDPRVRRALAFAFDFEWTNEALFFGQYARTESYFSNSELAARGLPEGEELEILERYRDRLPEEVFVTPYWAPSTDGSGWPRDNLIAALEMLNEAGWEVRDTVLVDTETGRPMRFEILLVSPAFERIALPFVRNLARLGIEANVRLVDQTQYVNRLRAFDFDMIVGGWGQSDSPGNEQRSYWTSESAEQSNSRNWTGLQNPVVDELVDLVVRAPDREALIQRTRALDRVLLWQHLVIPQWHIRTDRVLWWDKFVRPATEHIAKDGVNIDRWWYDEAKAQELAARERANPEILEAGVEEGAGTGGTPGWGTTLLAFAALAVLGWLVFRSALRRRTA